MRSPLPLTRAFDGDVASSALYAGESVDAVTGVVPAAAVVRELASDAEPLPQRGTVDRREHGG